MKKKLIISVSLCLLLCCGYIIYNHLNTKYVSVAADRNYCKTFDELENTSELIVKVKVTDKSQTFIERFDENMPVYGWTTTEVKVEKIYKAPSNFFDNTIKVREAYWDQSSPIDGKTIMCVDEYRPMKVNNLYILFLEKNDDGTYQPNYIEQGKYLINKEICEGQSLSSFKSNDLEIGSKEAPNYREFYSKVIKKYK